MLAMMPVVRVHDAPVWQHYLSGLRLSESLLLSWEPDAVLSIDLSGKHPKLRIQAEAEKGHRDRLLPITPGFATFLLHTPVKERAGSVFRLNGLITEEAITAKRVGRTVSAIGKRAGIVVNKADGKFGSAHDLRRAFATRWAGLVKPATLQLLMRHESIETTLKYYVHQNADDVADELWRCTREQGAELREPRGRIAQ